ncbi:two-component system sensor histidine kinase AgrC [Lachnospiraceae bacterium PF1-21]
MISNLNSILYQLIALSMVPIYRLFLTTFFNKKDDFKKNAFEVVLYLLYIIWQLQQIIGPINLIVNLFIFILISLVGYEGGLVQKIGLAFLFSISAMTIEVCCSFIFLNTKVNLLSVVLFSKLSLLLFVVLLRVVFSKTVSIKISNKNMFILLLVPTCSALVAHGMVRVVIDKANTKEVYGWTVVSITSLLLINVLVFGYYSSIVRKIQLEQRTILYENLINTIGSYQKEYEQSYLQLRRTKHNYNNDMLHIKTLIENRDYMKAVQKIDSLMYMASRNDDIIANSGNLFLDSLINYRYMIAKERGVEFKLELSIPMQLEFDGGDLNLILGNIIDNALEATSLLPEGKRFVKVKIEYKKKSLFVVVINSFNGIVNKDYKGRYMTTKNDSKCHGLGIDMARQAIEKYNGTMSLENDNNFFIAKVLLYPREQ